MIPSLLPEQEGARTLTHKTLTKEIQVEKHDSLDLLIKLMKSFLNKLTALISSQHFKRRERQHMTFSMYKQNVRHLSHLHLFPHSSGCTKGVQVGVCTIGVYRKKALM